MWVTMEACSASDGFVTRKALLQGGLSRWPYPSCACVAADAVCVASAGAGAGQGRGKPCTGTSLAAVNQAPRPDQPRRLWTVAQVQQMQRTSGLVTCFWFGQTKGPSTKNTVRKARGDKKPSTRTVLRLSVWKALLAKTAASVRSGQRLTQ